MSQRVLEGKFEIREQARLVEELCRLEPGQAALDRLLAGIADGLEQWERHVLADDRAGLQELLVLGRQAVDPGGQDRLDGRRDLDRAQFLNEAIAATFAAEGAGLNESADSFLEEEGRPLGLPHEHGLQRLERRVITNERVKKLASAPRRQGMHAQLAVVCLTAPSVAILGSVVDEHEQARPGEALD